MLKEYTSLDPQLMLEIAEAYHRNEIEQIEETSRLRGLCRYIPDGVPFVLKDTIIELTNPFAEEVKLLDHSLDIQRECGLIAAEQKKYSFEGSKYSISEQRVFTTLLMLRARRESRGYFTHTHWDTSRHSLPSQSDMQNISVLHDYYPYIEGRIVFLTERGPKVFRFTELMPNRS